MCLLLGGLLFPPGADEDAGHAVVALMAGGIEDHLASVVSLAHLDENGPGPGPGFGIVEGDFALQIVGVDAGVALGHLVGVDVGPAKALREIGGLDAESVAFPMTARV